MKRDLRNIVSATIMLGLALPGLIWAQTYEIPTAVIGGGGGTSTGGSYELSGTAGVPAGGIGASGGSYILDGGFWPTVQALVGGGALDGQYTIGPGGDYASFNAALDSLKIYGIAGPVTFLVKDGGTGDGIYNEQLTIPPIDGVSATDTIVFMPDTANNNHDVILNFGDGDDGISSTTNWVVRLDTAQYITFKDLTIQALDNTYARVIELVNDADHNNIFDNTLIGSPSTSSSDHRSIIFGNNILADSVVIDGNTFIEGIYGVRLTGAGPNPTGLMIEGNTFTDQVTRAIHIQYFVAPEIGWNEITASLSSGTSYYGLYIANSSGGTQINSNTIDAVNGGYGIYLGNSDGTPVTAEGLLANNVVHVGGTSTAWGIYCFSSDYQNIYHNSIHVTSTNTAYSAFYITGGSNVDVRNNIFANSGGGYAYYVEAFSSTAPVSSSDYNDIYTPGNYIGAWDAVKQPDLAALRTAMLGNVPPTGSEANSVFINPAGDQPSAASPTAE
jgi:hypothetical protein